MNVVQLPRRFVQSHWGGTETVILETSKRLLRHGHETVILCPNALAPTGQDADCMDGVPVRRVPYFYPYFGLKPEARQQLDLCGGSLFSFQLMRELSVLPRLDLIHLHTGRRPGAIGRYVARRRRIPYVVSLHGGVHDIPSEETELRKKLTDGALEWGKVLGWWVGSRRVMDDAAAVLCVGRNEYEIACERYPRKRIEYLPNGVDAERYADGDGMAFRQRHGIAEDAKVLLCVGRIDPQKDQKLLLGVLERLRVKHPTAHLVLVGHVTNPTYHAELLELIERLPAGSVTLIPGIGADTRELVDAYHAADCFVLASIHEPFGIVILEAWAAGRPVVASAVGGIPGFVEHGRDGLLCPPHDVDAFVEACDRVLSDRSLARKLASAGQTKACGPYSWDHITQTLISIYQDVIDENSIRK
jgi:glycosyltransferase involved in cell wall biosynthesis